MKKIRKFLVAASTIFLLTGCDLNDIRNFFTGKTSSSVESSSVESSSSSSDSSSSKSSSSSSQSSSVESSSSSSQSSSVESSSSSSSDSSSSDETTLKKLTILSINDLHGYIQDDTYPGISRLAYNIDEIRNENNDDDVVLIANGDMFQGTAISNLSHGLAVVNAMNAMDFDMMGVGNHEFDWGIEEVTQYFDNNEENGEANFPLVQSNIIKYSNGSFIDNTLEYEIIQRGNIKIGMMSGLSANEKSSILTSRVADYNFQDEATIMRNLAYDLRVEENCDIVIANVHDGGYSVSADINASLADCVGDYQIDAVINGHTHQYYSGSIQRSDGSRMPVVQAGANSNYLGRIDLSINSSKEVTAVAARTVQISSYGTKNSIVNNIVSAEYAKVQPKLETVVGTTGEAISYTTDLLDWGAEVIRSALDCDIGTFNTGGFRNWTSKSSNESVYIADLYALNPFDNQLVYVTMTGANMKVLFATMKNYVVTSYRSSISSYTSLNDSQIYSLCVIDYVFQSTRYTDEFANAISVTTTPIVMRDMLQLDVETATKSYGSWTPCDGKSSISKQYTI